MNLSFLSQQYRYSNCRHCTVGLLLFSLLFFGGAGLVQAYQVDQYGDTATGQSGTKYTESMLAKTVSFIRPGAAGKNDASKLASHGSVSKGSQVAATRLVTCGRETTASGTLKNPCGYNDLIDLINNGIGWLIGILVLVATLLFVYAGFLYVAAGADKSQAENAKSIFTNVAKGFAMVLLAWLLITSLVSLLVREDWQETWEQAIPIQLSERISNPDVS